MKIRKGFVLREVAGRQVVIATGDAAKNFNGIIKLNESAVMLWKLIEKGAERLGIDIIRVAERDGRKPDESLFGCADRVLCDVPCSGLGVIAKKPEIRYKSLDEFKRLPEIQLDILSASADYVKSGGVLLYSTCTVLPEENEKNVERFLKEHDDFEAVDFAELDFAELDSAASGDTSTLACIESY